MRIIIVADHAIAEGGAPQVAIASALGLAELGHEIVYLQGVGVEAAPALDAHPRIRRIPLGGTDIWRKSAPAAARDGIWNRAAARAAEAVFRAESGPDTLVHVHQWTRFFSPALFGAIRRAGLPFAISLHDYFIACPTGLMYRFDRAEPCSLRPLSPACLVAPCDPRSRLHKAIRFARGLAVGHALGTAPFAAIHVSETGRRTIGAHLPPAAQQFVLENPVEATDKGPREVSSARKLAYCGRLTREKGVLVVAEAARAAGLPALFIGEGPARAEILAIDPHAEITGWLDRETAADRLAAEALALVAPALWPETGPLVVAEAMARGVPAIASERCGAAGRVVEGENGFVTPPRSEAIAEAAQRLLEGDNAARMSAEAYHRYWADPPSPAAHARKLAAIYESLLVR